MTFLEKISQYEVKKISEQFCTNCGTQLTSEAEFCHKCGYKIQIVKGVPAAIEPERAAPTAKHTRLQEPRRARRRNTAVGIAIGVIAALIVPIIIIGIFGAINFVYIDTLEFDVESLSITEIDLIIDNNVGSIDIAYDESMTKLFEATLEVRGRPESNILDAENFVLLSETTKLVIQFEAGDYNFFFWNKKTFSYDIDITIHPNATVDFNVNSDTGSVTLIINGVDNLELGDLILTSNTGTITLGMTGSVNTTIPELELVTDTGKINVDLGERTELNDTEVLIDTDTGSISFAYEDLILYQDIVWSIGTNTGSITLNIVQNLVLNWTYTAVYDVKTNTGSITMNFIFNASIGINIYGTTDTGSVNLPTPGEYYENSLYSTADNVHRFTLETDTGSVTASGTAD